MGQALYRKYRSKSLDEIVGQEHITRTLKRAIATDHIAHAYLFTGPRGVGKTSIARILAHEFNQVPYNGEDIHLDIIEIDAASNGGVEEVRDLRDKVHIAPSSGKYKVYIIDEVHMMTTSAFNALLKTLEEPPAHAIFILATTEAHKLPATIISRTQQFIFKPVAPEKIIQHLRYIATEEHIDINDDALAVIAQHSEGSFRDSISMLDQAGSSGATIDQAAIEQLLGIPASETAGQIIQLLATHDTHGLIRLLANLRTNGYQAAAITRQLSAMLRQQFLSDKATIDKHSILSLLTKLIEVPASHYPDQLLELTLLDSALIANPAAQGLTISVPTEITPAAQEPAAAIQTPRPTNPTPPIAPHAAPSVISDTQSAQSNTPPPPKELSTNGQIDETQWQAVLTALGKQYNTLYGIVRMAKTEFSPGSIRLTFGYAFHQKRANDTKNKQVLMAVLENTTGQRLAIECLYDKTATPAAPGIPTPTAIPTGTAPTAGPPFGAINAIFGGGEVIS